MAGDYGKLTPAVAKDQLPEITEDLLKRVAAGPSTGNNPDRLRRARLFMNDGPKPRIASQPLRLYVGQEHSKKARFVRLSCRRSYLESDRTVVATFTTTHVRIVCSCPGGAAGSCTHAKVLLLALRRMQTDQPVLTPRALPFTVATRYKKTEKLNGKRVPNRSIPIGFGSDDPPPSGAGAGAGRES